jgi:hypothetical protein
LISDAIDRAVQSMNLQTLAGQTVFLDDTRLTDTVDRNYYISTLRQQLLASGCELRDKREEAEFIVEARAGAIGTDRNDQLFGLPSTNVPQIYPLQPIPGAMIPEIPIAKRKDQRGVAKVAVFAYHRETGTPVWQSGIVRQESTANDVWILGAGPFQRGTIYTGTRFAGTAKRGDGPKNDTQARRLPSVAVSQESLFTPPQKLVDKAPPPDQKVALASHQETSGASPAPPGAVASTSTTPAAAVPATNQTAAQPPAPVSSVETPASSTPTAPVAPASPSSGTSAKADPRPSSSTYARAVDATGPPQPRLNSPQ